MSTELTFLVCVFLAVLMLSQAMFVPVYQPKRGDTRLVRARLKRLAQELGEDEGAVSIAVENRLKKASPLGRLLESTSFINNLSHKLEQSGSRMLGYQYVMVSLLIAAALSVALFVLTNDWLLSAAALGIVLVLANLKLNRDFNGRMEKIEEQFPEALDILRRGLLAGYAFSDAVKLTYEEMDGPIAEEFRLMFAEINFSKDTRRALLHFIQRVPSVSAMAFATAVQVQKETGGNLAENIENITRIIRQRFKFKRTVKTHSAQGRLSAWVLVLVPLGLFAYIYFANPEYAKELTDTESGQKLLMLGGLGMVIGVYWIGKLVKIEV